MFTVVKFMVTEIKNARYGVQGAGLTIVSELILGDQVFLTRGQIFNCLR